MNKVFIIGNLTRDPEMRTTSTGLNVCSFTVAVNRRRSSNSQKDHPEADYFKVTAWRELSELCQKFLAKGKKVAVIGSISVSTYEGKDGTTRASMDVTADNVEFLSAREENASDSKSSSASESRPADLQVDEDELPF